MATIQIEESQLVGDYKILSAEAIAQVKETLLNASEETTIELPQGLLFLNLMDDDFEDVEPNENVIIKIPSTLIGYFSSDSLYGQRMLLPSFLEETNIASDFEGEYYDCELPQRKFRINAAARDAKEIAYKEIEDDAIPSSEDELNKCFDCLDGWRAFIEFADNASLNSCILEIENIKLDLYSNDYEAGAFFDVDGNKKMTLITSAWSYEMETWERALVQIRTEKEARREGWFNEFGSYNPSLLNVCGSSSLKVWTLLYNDIFFSWNVVGEKLNGLSYLYDGEYHELPLDSSDGK